MLAYLGLYSEDNKKMKADDVRAVNHYQLKIQIKIGGIDIWRRVLVSSNYYFRHFV